MKNLAMRSGRQPLTAMQYALISLAGILIAIFLMFFFIYKAQDLVQNGISEKIFYILLIPFGLAASAFIFGAMKSFASYKGQHLNGTLELGGPILLFIMVVAGGFKLIPSEASFSSTVYLRDKLHRTVIKNQGSLSVTIGDEVTTENIDQNGAITLKKIPANFLNKEVPVELDASGWEMDQGGTTALVKLTNESETVVIRKDSSLARVDVIVKDAENEPVPGVQLTLLDIRALTNERGEYHFIIPEEKQADSLPLRLYKAGFALKEVNVYPATKKEVQVFIQKKPK
jgi:hypothetical protein